MKSEQQAITIPQAIQIGLEHHEAGRLQAAEQIYRQVLQVDPNNAVALHLLGLVALQLGRSGVAVELIERAIRVEPSNPFFLKNLGEAYRGLGRIEDAESYYRRALALKPDYADACNCLGNALTDLGRLTEAEQCYRQVLALEPGYAEVHSNLGNTLRDLGRLAEAEESYRRALAINPDLAMAHNNLGNALRDLGRLTEAEESLRRALSLEPDYAEMHNNLGNALTDLGRLTQAEESYRRAVVLKPDYAEAHYNLGVALKGLGRLTEAEESLRRALALNPDHDEAHALWVNMCQYLCAWSEIGRQAEALRQRVSRDKSGRISPFSFLALPGTSGVEQLACARQFAEKAYGHFLSRPALRGLDVRPHRGKLRIGYLSADYFEHAISYLVAEVIERHDRSRFEVVGYSYGPDDGSRMRERMQAAFDKFHDVRHLSVESAARQICSDAIDVLVDLTGYTDRTRIQISALRPAPVQVNWLGYPGTLGHPRLADYVIGDPIVSPLEHAAQYSETLVLLPNCYQPNDRQRTVGPRPSRTEAGLPDEGLVFCCFNQSYKIAPAIFDLWCRLLAAVPGSLLWLLHSSLATQDSLRREAQARGVAAGRLVFAPKLALPEHLGRLQLADLALDTYPYTSHTTASDALWAGVPLVTLIGDTFVSRVASSILNAGGVPELVTRSAGSYYRLALDLASQPRRLKELRARLVANRMACPLFDSERFSRNLERAYARIWENYLAGKKEHVVLTEDVGRHA